MVNQEKCRLRLKRKRENEDEFIGKNKLLRMGEDGGEDEYTRIKSSSFVEERGVLPPPSRQDEPDLDEIGGPELNLTGDLETRLNEGSVQ